MAIFNGYVKLPEGNGVYAPTNITGGPNTLEMEEFQWPGCFFNETPGFADSACKRSNTLYIFRFRMKIHTDFLDLEASSGFPHDFSA